MIYDRKNKCYFKEKQPGQNLINFLYNTVIGRVLLKLIVYQPLFSKLWAIKYKSKKSKEKIKPFIEKYNINIDKNKINEFHSFNDFFTRKEEVKIESNLISPCTGKLLLYKINNNLQLKIKNTVYKINDIVDNKIDMNQYKNGLCLVFRLGLTDYHRYIYIDDGNIIKNYKINGKLHTVRSISDKYKVFVRNKREVSLLNFKTLGEVIQIEVGALTIGAIRNNNKKIFLKGEEKGYFEYGGSTIVILFKENTINIDNDITKQSLKGIETQIKIGERIGIKPC